MAKLHSDIRKYYIFRALLKRFILPITVVYATDQGLTLEQIALIASFGSVAGFILEVPSGAVADAVGHRRALVLSMIGQACAMAMYLGGTFFWIAAASVLYFAAGSFMTGTAEALFYERVKSLGLEKEHGRLYGQGKGFATAVSVIFMISAGAAYELAWYLPFLIGVAQYAAAGFVIASFTQVKETVSVREREGMASFLLHFSEAARAIRKNPKVYWLTVMTGLILGPLFALGDFQQAIMDDLGMTAFWIGMVYAGKRLLSIWVQGYVHVFAWRLGPLTLTFLSAMLMVLHLVLVGIIEDPALIIAPLMIGSIAWVGLEVAANDYLNRQIETKSRATALSMNNLVRSVVQLGSLMIFGALVAHVPAATAYGVMGVVLAVVMVMPMVMLTKAYKHV